MFRKNIDMEHIASGHSIKIETLTDDLVRLESSSDDGIVANGIAKFVRENVMASNGVIQAIDSVLAPQWFDTNIADLLASDPDRLSSLTSVGNKNVDFMKTISSPSEEPYTIFAPTNKAFSDSFIFDGNCTDSFQDFLGYHVVPGIHTGTDLMQTTELISSIGQALKVKVDLAKRTMRINGSLVIQSNILANNGVVHIIDGLLVPVSTPRGDIVSRDFTDNLTTAEFPSKSVDVVEPVPNERNSFTLTLEYKKCEPEKYSSNSDLNITAVLLRKKEHNKCLILRAREEARGDSGIQCDCQQVENGEVVFKLLCKAAITNVSCYPKYAQCNTSQDCCSNPLRQCRGSKCRDAISPSEGRRRHRTKFRVDGVFNAKRDSKVGKRRKGRNQGKVSF